jgi:peptide/nickel transport system ATP-binding protein
MRQPVQQPGGGAGDRAALLTVEDLHVSFRTPRGRLRAVNGVSFELGAGETLAIVGESGCGKSATALSLTRLLPEPTAQVRGRIGYGGQDILALSEPELRQIRGAQIAMVFQDPMSSLNPVLKVGIQIEETLQLHLKLGRREARRRAVELLGMVGIPDASRRLDAYPHEFSGGMRQRVMIAMALSCGPRIMVADEPTTALDVSVQAQILELLRSVIAEARTSLIIISHDLSVVAGLADRIAVMYAGELVEIGPTEQVFAHPRHPYTRALLECIPRLDEARKERLSSIEGSLPDLQRAKVGCPFAPRCAFVMERCWKDAPVMEQKAPGQWAASWSDLSRLPLRRETMPAPLAATPAPTRAAQADGDGTVLQVRDLRVHFPLGIKWPWMAERPLLKAVDGVSLEVMKGRTLGIVGESGCGKSTTGRAILQLVPPTSGEVLLEGRSLRGLDERGLRQLRPHMQMVFQDPYSSLNPRMTIGEMVGEPLIVHHTTPRNRVPQRVAELLEMVGLRPSLADWYPHQLSGGLRQRVSIARALALRPSLIVADEPTSALDVSVRAQILNLMQDLQREHGLSYVFISHDLSVVRHMSDLVAVMYLGKVVEMADRDTLYVNPEHPYTQALLSVVPIPDPAVERARRRTPIQGDVPNPAHPPTGCNFNTRCPFAFDRCFVEEPPLYDLGPRHRAACFLATPEPEAGHQPSGSAPEGTLEGRI